jgi:hypothetical protein
MQHAMMERIVVLTPARTAYGGAAATEPSVLPEPEASSALVISRPSEKPKGQFVTQIAKRASACYCLG